MGYEIPLKPVFILPDVMTEQCLRPVQTTQFVHAEIANGLKRLRSYCHSIGEPEIEFVDSQNTLTENVPKQVDYNRPGYAS